MNQSFETQLQVVLRALGEVVLPALAGAEKHVVEQLQLSMAALEFMRQRLAHAGLFFRNELADHAALAESVADLVAPHDIAEASDLRALALAGRATLERAAADWADYVAATRQLRAAVAGAVEHSADAPHEHQLSELVVTTATEMHRQSRAWYLPFGFELQPETLPRFAAIGEP